MAQTNIILVTAATGTQSSALIRALSSWSSSTSTSIIIHGTTRNAASLTAQDLVTTNSNVHCTVKLFNVDFNDPPSLLPPAMRATHAFLNVTPDLADMTLESKHAHNILNALRTEAADTLERIVYTSVHSLNDPSVPGNYNNLDAMPWMKNYYKSKYGIEVSVANVARELAIPYTLLQPGTFLTNLLPPASTFMYAGLATPGQHTIRTALQPSHISGWLDPEYIGQYALRAVISLPTDSQEYQTLYRGKKVPIAAFPLTLAQVVGTLNAYLDSTAPQDDPRIPPGTKVKIDYISAEEAEHQKEQNPLVASQLFQNDNQQVFRFDPKLSEVYGINMGSVAAFWVRQGKAGRVADALGYA